MTEESQFLSPSRDLIQDDNQLYEKFLSTLKSDETRKTYRKWLKYATNDDVAGFLRLARNNRWRAQDYLIDWILKRRGKNGDSMTGGIISATKSLCDYAELTLSWRKIQKTVLRKGQISRKGPTPFRAAQAIYERADLRLKWILGLFMAGLRVGAFDWMSVKDLTEVQVNDVKIGILRVYPGEEEEYLAFLTPEALGNWHLYKKFREEAGGETIGPDSPLVRNIFDPLGATRLRRLSKWGVCDLLLEEWQRLFAGEVRTFKMTHGFRSLFRTLIKTPGVIDKEDAEHMTGHKDAYFKPEFLQADSEEFNLLLTKYSQCYHKVELSKASHAIALANKAVEEKKELETSVMTELRLLKLENEKKERELTEMKESIRELLERSRGGAED